MPPNSDELSDLLVRAKELRRAAWAVALIEDDGRPIAVLKGPVIDILPQTPAAAENVALAVLLSGSIYNRMVLSMNPPHNELPTNKGSLPQSY